MSCRFLRQSGDPAKRARAIVQAVSPPNRAPPFFVSITETASKVTHYNNPKILAQVRTRFDSNPVFRFVMVNVNGCETGLGEHRRAYGGLVNKVSGVVASCGRLRRSKSSIIYFSDENLKGGRLANRGW
jgi:hypothetical protein